MQNSIKSELIRYHNLISFNEITSNSVFIILRKFKNNFYCVIEKLKNIHQKEKYSFEIFYIKISLSLKVK